MRYQQVYEASDFIFNPNGGYIWALSFRPDAEMGRLAFANLDLQVNLSTTSRGADSLSPVFADNIGLDETVVFGRGPFQLSTGGTPHFDVHIILSQPFFYNPHSGNLLLDIRNFGGGETTWFDASERTDDSVSRVWALGVNSPSGTADTKGLVTGFSITPIPEPGTGLILLTGLGAFALARWRVIRSSQQERSPATEAAPAERN